MQRADRNEKCFISVQFQNLVDFFLTRTQKLFWKRRPYVTISVHLLQLPGDELDFPEVVKNQQRCVRFPAFFHRHFKRFHQGYEFIALVVEDFDMIRRNRALDICRNWNGRECLFCCCSFEFLLINNPKYILACNSSFVRVSLCSFIKPQCVSYVCVKLKEWVHWQQMMVFILRVPLYKSASEKFLWSLLLPVTA